MLFRKPRTDPTKGSVKGWYFNTKEKWWYHRHRKGLGSLGKKYYVETSRNDFCVKCGKAIPPELIKMVDAKLNRKSKS